MPTDCSYTTASIIEQVDVILSTGTNVQKQALKSIFGLGLVTHDDDFARYAAHFNPCIFFFYN